MGVADHLRIELDEYDALIRSFVPTYEAMLRAAAEVVGELDVERPAIVDLGIGTGALAEACLGVRPKARLTGIDADPGMLAAARNRLAVYAVVELVEADFLDVALPPSDAIVSSLALHHVADPAAKRALYARCHDALGPGGVLVTADRFRASDGQTDAAETEAWLAHLERAFTRAEAEAHLEAWAREDTYFPLDDEIEWLRDAGLAPQVHWHVDGFAVVASWAGARAGASPA